MGRSIYNSILSTDRMDKRIDDSFISINLQLFADPDKTEDPTPRRLEKAREEGNIPQSNEFNMAVSFLSISLFLWVIFEPLLKDIFKVFYDYLSLDLDFSPTNLLGYEINAHMNLYIKLILFFVVAVVVSILLGMIQTKFLFTFKSLKLDLSKINPIKGFKRLFSLRSVMELVKALLKLTILGLLTYNIIKANWYKILSLAGEETAFSFNVIFDLVINILFQLGIALLLLSLFDFWYQRYEYKKELKMSKYEVKQERKEIEGNPEIKQRQRELMRNLARSRMMQKVPEADVVVTNPTHYAIAIEYKPEEMQAPIVVAKGKDEVAFKIRDIAFKHGIPILERPALAREIYEKVDLNEEIPEHLYTLVAEVLAYVYKLSY
ncbi:flagellar biosynthetic protein FlhB [Petrotoga miotherma DSM 10691]|uniref:Flagellar biosynthetic protein FlhB n=1 Tax=Petrotoga miotherma DSM 10691 TaxID=1434326 RepID=A0A2K1P3F7_9BACT|nr:flagellar biosynthesis protein FlhB [Petrotoga miotherma]PNR97310.1 flagellar biosynthetic protein FlhB [Petrotoga miotherma DSM 10691]